MLTGIAEDDTAPGLADRETSEAAAAQNTLARYIPLTRVAAEIPPRRRGRRMNVSTLYRWTTSGCRGVRLRYIQVGATRCTTRSWLDEFFAALTQASVHGPTPAGISSGAASLRIPRSRRLAIERASRELDALGI